MRADLLREIEAAADAALATDDPLAVVATRLVIGLAVLLGVVLARRSRAHWPVPVALGLALDEVEALRLERQELQRQLADTHCTCGGRRAARGPHRAPARARM